MAAIAISHALSYMITLSIILAGIMGYTYPYLLRTTGDRTDRGEQVQLLYELLYAYTGHYMDGT